MKASLGYSMIEIMIVIAIIGIVLAIALPNGAQFITNSRMTSQANDIVGDVLLARSEAASRGVTVSICPSAAPNAAAPACSAAAADWGTGRIIFSDSNSNGVIDAGETVLKVTQVTGNSTLSAPAVTNLVSIGFSAYGGVSANTIRGSVTFKLCPPSFPTGRQIAINVNGRPSVTRVNCP